jgi:uncharacterized protein (TIGR02996 family)
MNSLQQAVYQAIIDEPEEDLHRLAYADLCEESGDLDRATYIRLQIKRMNKEEGIKEFRHIEDRIWKDHTAQIIGMKKLWEQEFNPSITYAGPSYIRLGTPPNKIGFGQSPDYHQIVYQRGFPAKITCSMQFWLDNAKSFCQSMPLTAVSLLNKGASFIGDMDDNGEVVQLWSFQFPGGQSYSEIDEKIANYLTGKRVVGGSKTWIGYPVSGNPDADLSNACIKYGRSK